MTDTGDKRLFLTFDDGPSALYTPQLLDLLAFHDVKATFFVLGEASIQNPRIIERMLSEGHELGVHAYDHRKSVWRMSREEFGRDLDDTLAGIAAASGGEYPPPRFYRPPWGRTRAFSHDEVAMRGLTLVKWDVMAQDWQASMSARRIEARLRRRIFPGAVICLHDGRGRVPQAPARTIESLRHLLPDLLWEGYRFETL